VKERLRDLQAGGGTEMTAAMIEALKPLRPDSQRQVILLTDGYIGFEREVIGEVLRHRRPGCRVHTVGVGSAPNRTLTRGVARAGWGGEVIAGELNEAPVVAREVLQATVGPVLTELSIGGSACVAAAPANLRDVLAGRPLVATVELKPAGGVIQVRGRLAGQPDTWSWSARIAPRGKCLPAAMPAGAPSRVATTPLPVGALFGRESVEDLELKLAASDEIESQHIEGAIEALGLRHRISTRCTSLVAVCEEPAVDPSAPRRRYRLPVELPAGVSDQAVGLSPAPRIAYLTPPPVELSRHFYSPIRRMRGGLSSAMEELLRDHLSAEAPAAGWAAAMMARARLTRRDGDLLVVEFEAPADGFMLPGPGTRVAILDIRGEVLDAEVEEGISTRPGPHEAGLTLRLGLRRREDGPWPERVFWITWTSPDGDPVRLRVGPAAAPGQ
jgi:hypothetical protein